MNEFEQAVTSLTKQGLYPVLHRQAQGWHCNLFNSVMKGVPSGQGATMVEALNAACRDQLEMKAMGR